MAKYNLTEKKEKAATYRKLVRTSLVDELFEKIVHKMLVEQKYRDPDYSAKKLAEELGTNTRYISAVISLRFSMNYATLVNEYRIKEAMYMLIEKRYANMTMEDISRVVGFSNRQSFYASFYRIHQCSPRQYKINHAIPGGEDEEAAKKEAEKKKKAEQRKKEVLKRQEAAKKAAQRAKEAKKAAKLEADKLAKEKAAKEKAKLALKKAAEREAAKEKAKLAKQKEKEAARKLKEKEAAKKKAAATKKK